MKAYAMHPKTLLPIHQYKDTDQHGRKRGKLLRRKINLEHFKDGVIFNSNLKKAPQQGRLYKKVNKESGEKRDYTFLQWQCQCLVLLLS